MTTKEKVTEAANRAHGGFVNTDGDWCMTRTPSEFRGFLAKLGFEVTECKETAESTAIAITAEGYKIAWNGYCRRA